MLSYSLQASNMVPTRQVRKATQPLRVKKILKSRLWLPNPGCTDMTAKKKTVDLDIYRGAYSYGIFRASIPPNIQIETFLEHTHFSRF